SGRPGGPAERPVRGGGDAVLPADRQGPARDRRRGGDLGAHRRRPGPLTADAAAGAVRGPGRLGAARPGAATREALARPGGVPSSPAALRAGSALHRRPGDALRSLPDRRGGPPPFGRLGPPPVARLLPATRWSLLVDEGVQLLVNILYFAVPEGLFGWSLG